MKTVSTYSKQALVTFKIGDLKPEPGQNGVLRFACVLDGMYPENILRFIGHFKMQKPSRREMQKAECYYLSPRKTRRAKRTAKRQNAAKRKRNPNDPQMLFCDKQNKAK